MRVAIDRAIEVSNTLGLREMLMAIISFFVQLQFWQGLILGRASAIFFFR